METVKLYVGRVDNLRDGRQNDLTDPVEFTGEKVTELTTFGRHKGQVSDTRGTTETLYRTEKGQLAVHVHEWSKWQGEPEHYTLHEVTEADLDVGGNFESLGREADFGRPLTLAEGMARSGGGREAVAA